MLIHRTISHKRIFNVSLYFAAVGLAAVVLTGIANSPVFAQSTTYSVCTVHVPNAGDSIPNPYLGPPSHWYISLVFQGGDGGASFLAWSRRTFGASWIRNPYSQSDSASVGCNSYSTFIEANNYLNGLARGYDQQDNSWDTMTNWPSVVNP